MITGFAIIFEEDILYCSNESHYSSFEIILFIEKLISSLNPKKTWRLNSIYLKGYRMGKERLVIKHLITETKENIFFCVGGDFFPNSIAAKEMLEEFYTKVNLYYKNSELLKQASKKKIFGEIIETITDFLWDKYEEILEKEVKTISNGDYSISNNILYCGISSQGLPIISQLYSKIFMENLDIAITEENVELCSSNISAKLATIAMNTEIRAKTSIREIIIDDILEEEPQKIIFFGKINGFFLDFFASGDFYQLKKVFKKFKDKISKEEILHKEFTGDLKPYRYIHEVINKFYEEGL
ncbi:MAG: hypothetical protein ACTSQJ_01015 [Promethearchaeota archaeon]